MIFKKKSVLSASMSAIIAVNLTASCMLTTVVADDNVQSVVDSQFNPYGFDVDIDYISLADGRLIDKAISDSQVEMVSTRLSDNVVIRDWDDYVSDYVYQKLPANAKVLCDRLDEIFRYYLEHSDTNVAYVKSFEKYFCNGAIYSDLGFDKNSAIAVAKWFLYTHPHYYYLAPHFAVTDRAVYIACYDDFVKGTDRAVATNKLFDQIDKWVDEVTDTEISTYQIEVSAHDLLCDYITYKDNDHDQSVYSIVANDGEGVCVGYSAAFSMIMNAADVQTLIGVGAAHEWNLVKLDNNKWYGVDLTWDDSLKGKQFFNCGTSSFYRMDRDTINHIYDTRYADWYPEMSVTNYTPNTYDLTGQAYDTDTYPFNKPYNVVSTKIDDTTYRLTWSAIKNVQYYDIEIYEDDVLSRRTTSNTNTIRLTNIDTTKPVSVKIRACGVVDNKLCYSDWTGFAFELTNASNDKPSDTTSDVPSTSDISEPVADPVKPVDPVDPVKPPVVDSLEDNTPAKPINLVADSSQVGMTRVSWKEIDAVSGYEVTVYSDKSYINQVSEINITTNSLKLASLNSELDSELYVRVRAYNIVGSKYYYSDYADIRVVIKADIKPADTSSQDTSKQVSAPENIKVALKTSSSVTCSWDAVKDALAYDVKVCSDAAGDDVIANARVHNNRVSLTKLSSSSVYYVFVRAVERDGIADVVSDWSIINFKVDDMVKPTPSETKPSGLESPIVIASHLTNSSVRLQWTSVNNASCYAVEVYSDAKYENLVARLDISDLSMKLTSARKRDYYVRVQAVNTNSVSDWTQLKISF